MISIDLHLYLLSLLVLTKINIFVILFLFSKYKNNHYMIIWEKNAREMNPMHHLRSFFVRFFIEISENKTYNIK